MFRSPFGQPDVVPFPRNGFKRVFVFLECDALGLPLYFARVISCRKHLTRLRSTLAGIGKGHFREHA